MRIKCSRNRIGVIVRTCWPPSRSLQYGLWKFYFILCNPLLLRLFWLNCLCHKDASSLPDINSRLSLFPSWLNFHLFYCYRSDPGHHHYLPERIQWSPNSSTSISVACVLSRAARAILINQNQIMSLCYCFRAGTLSLYLWISSSFHWNLADSPGILCWMIKN